MSDILLDDHATINPNSIPSALILDTTTNFQHFPITNLRGRRISFPTHKTMDATDVSMERANEDKKQKFRAKIQSIILTELFSKTLHKSFFVLSSCTSSRFVHAASTCSTEGSSVKNNVRFATSFLPKKTTNTHDREGANYIV